MGVCWHLEDRKVLVEIPLLVECKAMYAHVVVEVFVDFVAAHVFVVTIIVDRKFFALFIFYIPILVLVDLVV